MVLKYSHVAAVPAVLIQINVEPMPLRDRGASPYREQVKRMDKQNPDVSLFEAVGGAEGVSKLVDSFYERVFSDPELAPYFGSVSAERLKRMQLEFFSAALDGPTQYLGRPVAHAHQHLKIDRPSFQRFVGHLFETLQGLSLDDDQRYDVIARVNLYVDDVLGVGAGFGD